MDWSYSREKVEGQLRIPKQARDTIAAPSDTEKDTGKINSPLEVQKRHRIQDQGPVLPSSAEAR